LQKCKSAKVRKWMYVGDCFKKWLIIKPSKPLLFSIICPKYFGRLDYLHQWKGLRAQQTDASFCQFESLEYGWRAAFYLLTRTYYHKYRLFTIRAIINKWAPPNENLTSTYIQNVSRLTGIPPDEPIGIPSDQPARWMAVGVAMAIQENGTDSLDYFAMLKGWTLARDGT